jgi:hypothetical protein
MTDQAPVDTAAYISVLSREKLHPVADFLQPLQATAYAWFIGGGSHLRS